MELNGLNSAAGNYGVNSSYTKASFAVEAKEKETTAEHQAVVYEKAEESRATTYNPNKKVDQNTIDQLKKDAEERFSQLQDLVNKLISGQANAEKTANLPLGDLMQKVADGEIEVDPKDVEQAKKDVAEGGYWSVEETAKRLVDFAKTLSGNDPSKASELRKAIDKGFGDATKAWGRDLPEISAQTYDRVNEMLDDWIKESY